MFGRCFFLLGQDDGSTLKIPMRKKTAKNLSVPPRETEESIYTKCGLERGWGAGIVGMYVHLVGGRPRGRMGEGDGVSKGPVRRVYDVPRAQELDPGPG
jgi:hypothetical protein